MNESNRPRIAVVTDSTCDMPRHLVAQYGIHVIPQILIMGEKNWLDGIDIDPPAFYALLRTSSAFPTTSQPSVASFQELFTKLSAEYEGIVAVLISNELSGTINSAVTAAAALPNVQIEIVDSRAASMQLGLITLAAARAADAGGDLATVAGAARALVNKVRVYFVVDTLEYLHRGGRIGAAARLFGTALNLKPVLQVFDGVVTPVARIRSRRKALDEVLKLIAADIPAGSRARMAVLHVACAEEAAQFSAEVAAQFHPVEMIAAECGPVIGAHAGPGTLGVAYYVE